MSQDALDTVDLFIQELERQEASALTIRNYHSDLAHFQKWFDGSTGEPFSPTAITPTDIRDYRSHLLTVERRAPSTINRRLAALRKFFQWAKADGLVNEAPT